MDRVNGIKKLTDNRFLNLYELDATFRDGSNAPYYVASRRKNIESLKAVTHDNHADGVILYGVHSEKKDKVVLVRQFRYPINGYVYEFPAGLVEPGEDMLEAGIREMYEETGLDFAPISTARPYFTTIGMTDESCGTVFGYCSGDPSNAHQEGTEDIQVVLADREECKRILKEENVAIMCAYMLMHFIASEGDPLTFLLPDNIIQIQWSEPMLVNDAISSMDSRHPGLYYLTRVWGNHETSLYIGKATNTIRERLKGHSRSWLHLYRGKKYVRIGTIVHPKSISTEMINDIESALIFEHRDILVDNTDKKYSYTYSDAYQIQNLGNIGELKPFVDMADHIDY